MRLLLVGYFALIYGMISLVLRFAYPQAFSKMAPMRDKMGKAGIVLHYVKYTIIPILIGVLSLSKYYMKW